jgi:RecA-family ATPase
MRTSACATGGGKDSVKKRLLIALLISGAALWGQKKVYPERWVYVSSELGSDQALERFRDIARTAAEHGLTAILFSSGFDRLDLQPAENIARETRH